MNLAHKLLLALSLLGPVGAAQAHDTDIYTNTVASASAKPLIMFYLDMRTDMLAATACGGGDTAYCNSLSSAGWLDVPVASAKRLDLYRAILKKVMTPLVTTDPTTDPPRYKIGLMINHANNGGMVMMGFADSTTTNLNVFLNKLKALPTKSSSSISHKLQPTEMYFEFYRYLTGGAVSTGTGLSYASDDYCTSSKNNCSATVNIDNSGHYTNTATQWGGATAASLAVDLAWDPATINTGVTPNRYYTPIESACQKIFVLTFTKGVVNQDADQDTAIQAQYTAGGMANSSVGRTVSYTNTNRFNTVLKLLYQAKLADGTWNSALTYAGSDNNVTSYFFVDGPSTTQNDWAKDGSGGLNKTAYDLSTSADAVEQNISDVFSQILSVSTTFVAPTVAVNVYNRAQVLSDIYIAMFQVLKQPTWPGNIKKFNLGTDAAGNLQLNDANGNNGVSPLDGRMAYSALSYWTDSTSIPPVTSPLPYPHDSTDVAGRDGRNVRLGGAGCRIPGYIVSNTTPTSTPGLTNATGSTTLTGKRIIYTEPASFTNGTAATLRAFEANATLADDLKAKFGPTVVAGTCVTTEITDTSCNYIKYVRGLNPDNTARNYTSFAWLLGDLLHSRPLAVNYGIKTGTVTTHGVNNPNIRLVVGSNDGLLHMFRNTAPGNVDSTDPNWKLPATTGYQDGVEAWAFMPTETMGMIPTLKTNSPTKKHPYGVDGTPMMRVVDNNGDGNIDTSVGQDDKVYVYFGLRRGGRAYYALDISNPDAPKLLWKISNTSPGMSQLGQTWSTPRFSNLIYGGATSARPVLIFGGGYDPNKDDNATGHTAAAGGNDSQGNAVFIVNADTGAVVWKAIKGASDGFVAASGSEPPTYTRTDMDDSIPSSVTLVDYNGNNKVDRIYVGDTGGRLWRIDTLSTDEANWTVVPLLSVGRHVSGATAGDDRRFFNAPDYSRTVDASNNRFDAVVIGTGDRENPLGVGVTNWIYMFKDYDIESGNLAGYTARGTATHNSAGLTNVSADCVQQNSSGCPAIGVVGWKMRLECMTSGLSGCGEKNLASALTLGGTIVFTTYTPTAASGASCGPSEGIGRVYYVDLQNAGSTLDLFTGNSCAGGGSLCYMDRSEVLEAPGIPPEAVLINAGTGLIGTKPFKLPISGGLKTFWFEKYKP